MSKYRSLSTNKAVHIQPKNPAQDRLLRSIADSQLTVAIGPAGVGKTWCAVNAAVNLLQSGKVRRIVLTRANLSVGRSLGFFPGTLYEKMTPWLMPMISVIKSRLGPNDYESKLHAGTIDFQPLETIRGMSYEDTIILVDEAQNLSYEEIKAITTRIGESSRMVLMGDPMQRDIGNSGLSVFSRIVDHYDLPIPVITFDVSHIVRSDIVADLVRTFLDYEKGDTK